MNEMETIYQRTEILVGKDNVEKLKTKHIVVFGVGGVGSFVVEALARVGIGNISVIDKDVVDITNINRQLIATNKTIGMDKVEVAKERILDINKDANILAFKENVTLENIDEIFSKKITTKIDYVVDCVDNVDAKIAIMQKCYNENIKCISSMGMGNKLNPLDIRVGDIFKTSVCPLAKKIRKRLKELEIKKQKVIYSIELPKQKTEQEKELYGNTLGSISFVPSVGGLVIASEVVKDLI